MRNRDGKIIPSLGMGRKENALNLMDESSVYSTKPQWDSSYGPVEIGQTREVQTAPVELPDRNSM